MNRQRSPSYPAISITQAIDLAGKIHKTCRSNVIDRETAAREMGYSGLTGRSMKVLSDLLQFSLLEKEGKGNVKVTQLAVDILHGIDPKDREQATLEAALAPQLFKDIHERFPDGIPSENAIRSYLIQQDFQDSAISPAITAFMETYRAVEDIRESKSHGALVLYDENGGQQDAPEHNVGRGTPPPPVSPPPSPPPPAGANASGYRVMEGERVVFSEETSAEQYLKLVTAGEMNGDLLEALEDYVKRQKKRLGIAGEQTQH